jgi:Phage integrase family
VRRFNLLFEKPVSGLRCYTACRIFHLRTALHIMAPKVNFDWITRPDDVPLDAILQQEPRDDMFIPDAKLLFDWGLGLMTDQPVPDDAAKRLEACQDYRNGLIIALLACRAPRLGSLAQMRLGKNLYKRNGEYWARLQSMIVKNRRELHYSLPETLTPYIDRYLSEIRPILLDPVATDAVWGNGDGGAYTYRSIQTMIFRQTQAETGTKFDEDFGPHRFRHSFATALAEADPTNPGLAAVILGITEPVVNEHYRKARQADTARKLQANLREERERTRATAERAFGMRSLPVIGAWGVYALNRQHAALPSCRLLRAPNNAYCFHISTTHQRGFWPR